VRRLMNRATPIATTIVNTARVLLSFPVTIDPTGQQLGRP
jgi:hypothetical protein